MRLVLDPGHGGKDSGCEHGDIVEKHYVLALAKQLQAAVRGTGWDVSCSLTRDTDDDTSFAVRRELSRRADLVLSIHVNAAPTEEASGCAAYYWPGNARGAMVADAIARAVPVPLLRKERGRAYPATDEPGPHDDHLRRAHNVLKAFLPTTVLVECGFASNPWDEMYLRSDAGQRGLVAAMLCGIAVAPKGEANEVQR